LSIYIYLRCRKFFPFSLQLNLTKQHNAVRCISQRTENFFRLVFLFSKVKKKIFSRVETQVCVLELYDLILFLSVLGVVSSILIYGITRLNPAKRASKSGSDGVRDMYSVYSDQIKDILKLKDNHIKRLNAEIQQYAVEPDEVEGNNPAKYEDLKALAKEAGINPLILEMPFVKNQIKKYTKGMSIEEIISTVKELKGFIGNQKSKSTDQAIPQDQAGYF